MAQTSKLTVRVDSTSLGAAKHYAAVHNTSLSKLISEFLTALGDEDAQVPQTPILRKLTGILPAEASVENHRAYLARKYG
jgi:hypothetical protein